ncbi:ATP-dependent Clp protease proteolytic subunit [Pseudomonas qingdaonensis]|nr:ATP-dependent Clp protease proteolytic subunit [Pseudomonas qingdaonensis]
MPAGDRRRASALLLNLSTIGGSTHLGFSIYSFLKSLPVPVSAVNAGNIESMGIVMYLAASERLAVPHSRFLIHPMTWHFSQSAVDHSRLREYLSSLNNDLGAMRGSSNWRPPMPSANWTSSTACRPRNG